MHNIDPYLRKLHTSGIERKIPNITEKNAECIGKILLERSPKNILEIGTANGYSALAFANIFRKNESDITKHPNIFTIEYAWNAHNEAVEHFAQCKTKNIFPILWDAKTVINAFADGLFDVVYIDAMKKEYLDYLLLSLPKTTDNALFIIDDVEKFAHKMENLYDFLHTKNIPYMLHKTDEDDSIMTIERNTLPKN